MKDRGSRGCPNPDYPPSHKKDMIRGSSDFFGLNHYTTNLAFNTFQPASDDVIGYYDDRECGNQNDYTWPTAKSVWLFEVTACNRVFYMLYCLGISFVVILNVWEFF